jgi:transcriptional regulator with XRE-family HTH domain
MRRVRLLRGMKQAYLAELMTISQSQISRLESGEHIPSPDLRTRILSFIAACADSSVDRNLRRLVETASFPVHLICDATHVLLAASPSREAEWRARVEGFRGSSLWRFATDEIAEAESKLGDNGWFDGLEDQCLLVATTGNGSQEMRILPSILEWERIALSDGRMGRLVTTVDFT